MEKMYIVHEMIGNFSREVFRSEYFYEVQDYLEEREHSALGYDADDAEIENFYSYFDIEEKIISENVPTIYVDTTGLETIISPKKVSTAR